MKRSELAMAIAAALMGYVQRTPAPPALLARSAP